LTLTRDSEGASRCQTWAFAFSLAVHFRSSGVPAATMASDQFRGRQFFGELPSGLSRCQTWVLVFRPSVNFRSSSHPQATMASDQFRGRHLCRRGARRVACGSGSSVAASRSRTTLFAFRLNASFRSSGLSQAAMASDQIRGRHFIGEFLPGFAVPAGDGRIGNVAADRSQKPDAKRTRKERPARRGSGRQFLTRAALESGNGFTAEYAWCMGRGRNSRLALPSANGF
jgi:hypothetical protein